jgi:hypothetical protein
LANSSKPTLPRIIFCSRVIAVLLAPRRPAWIRPAKTTVAAHRPFSHVRSSRDFYSYRQQIDPSRLVFIDETWSKTNLAPLRGWAPRGERLTAKVPHRR